jgi:carboxylate-amine ligase
MYRAGSIRTLKDLWWDLRPSPRYGTLEIRVCDQFSNLGEALAVIAFVHALGKWFELNQSWLEEMPRPGTWRLRENKWRAMRYGLDAQLVTNNIGDTCSITEDIKKWLDRARSQYVTLGYEPYRDLLLSMLERGNSAKRQETVWANAQSLESVARFNCRELEEGKPLWQLVDTLKSEKPKETPKKAESTAA